MSDAHARSLRKRAWKQVAKHGFLAATDAAFVAGTPHLAFLQGLGFPADRCTLGCDVIDNSLFRNAGPMPSPGSGLRLVTCARLIPEKNLPVAVMSFRELNLPFSWRIVGDGPERDAVSAAVGRAALGDKIQLPGRVEYTGLPAVHRQHDVYFQPSISDTWALAVNEAMASGMPVLVSKQCGCHEDLVKEGVNGFTFDARDPAAIRAAVTKMWEARDRWPEMGRASQDIIKDWDLDRFAKGLYDACEIALRRSKERRARRSWAGRRL
ncbi:MAG: glycosyltransferase [Deltaproteobacteria bacterium]|nr:glycosyltransferase [Deltaproteobacteria bacterium]